MAGEVLILKHVSNEGAGTFALFLEKKNILFRSIELYKDESLPENLDSIRAVLIMGGPMNVNVYAFQFHVEVDEAILKDWFNNSKSLPAALSEYACYRERLSGLTEKIYERFFSLW